jgi:hypothetical protein
MTNADNKDKTLRQLLGLIPPDYELTGDQRSWAAEPPVSMERFWEERPARRQVYFKHTMSCLSDQAMQLVVDHERRIVRLEVGKFDSALVASCIFDLQKEAGGVIAFRDDDQKDDLWLTKPAHYRLVIVFAGLELEAQVVKLFNGGVAVTLEPPQEEKGE